MFTRLSAFPALHGLLPDYLGYPTGAVLESGDRAPPAEPAVSCRYWPTHVGCIHALLDALSLKKADACKIWPDRSRMHQQAIAVQIVSEHLQWHAIFLTACPNMYGMVTLLQAALVRSIL